MLGCYIEYSNNMTEKVKPTDIVIDSLGKVAVLGDFGRRLDERLAFGQSRLLREVGQFVESGKFEEGLEQVWYRLKRRKINVEYVRPHCLEVQEKKVKMKQ